MIGWAHSGAFALGLLAATVAQDWRYGEQINADRASAAQLLLARQIEGAARMAAADTKFTGELEDARSKTAELERRVAAGPTRLYIAAKCPAAPSDTAASLGDRDGEKAELNPNARLDYYALRRGIAEVEAALRVCVGSR